MAGTKPLEEAMVTAGGVAGQVNPKTMASKKTAGLYFAGGCWTLTGSRGANLTKPLPQAVLLAVQQAALQLERCSWIGFKKALLRTELCSWCF